MQCYGGGYGNAPFWFFLVIACLSHARGTLLLVRAGFRVFVRGLNRLANRYTRML